MSNQNNLINSLSQADVLKNTIKKSIKARTITKQNRLKNIKQNRSKLSNDITPKSIQENNIENLPEQEQIDTRLDRTDIMTEIRQNLNDVNNNQFDRENLKQNDDSFNLTNQNKNNPSPFSNDDEINITNQTEKPIDSSLETEQPLQDDAVASKIASSGAKVGEALEDTAEAVEVAGGGPEDPISDIISGAIAIGGAIATGLDIDKDKTSPPPVPVIQQGQSLESTNI